MADFDPDWTSTTNVLLFHGETTDIKVLDPDGHPNHVLDPSKDFKVELEWNLTGQLVPLHLDWPGAEFEIKVFAESMGPGPELELTDPIKVPTGTYTGGYFDRTYKAVVEIDGGQLPEHKPGGTAEAPGQEPASGVYKLVTTVWLNGAIPGPYDVIGFEEGPIIQMESLD